VSTGLGPPSRLDESLRGPNLAITAGQLQQVLSSDTVKQLAARFHIPVGQLAQVLAQQLPKAVDHASPDGKLPHTARGL
jgi:uncharacterized protein YidB (DUF937 family)